MKGFIAVCKGESSPYGVINVEDAVVGGPAVGIGSDKRMTVLVHVGNEGAILLQQAVHRGGSWPPLQPQDEGSRLISILRRKEPEEQVRLGGFIDCNKSAVGLDRSREWQSPHQGEIS